MRRQGCVFMHTQAIGSDNWKNCQRETRAAMDRFAAAHGLAVAARIAEWCREGNAYSMYPRQNPAHRP